MPRPRLSPARFANQTRFANRNRVARHTHVARVAVARFVAAIVVLAGVVAGAGCESGGSKFNSLFGGGASRVPPPPTGSFGKASGYYPNRPSTVPPATPGLVPVSGGAAAPGVAPVGPRTQPTSLAPLGNTSAPPPNNSSFAPPFTPTTFASTTVPAPTYAPQNYAGPSYSAPNYLVDSRATNAGASGVRAGSGGGNLVPVTYLTPNGPVTYDVPADAVDQPAAVASSTVPPSRGGPSYSDNSLRSASTGGASIPSVGPTRPLSAPLATPLAERQPFMNRQQPAESYAADENAAQAGAPEGGGQSPAANEMVEQGPSEQPPSPAETIAASERPAQATRAPQSLAAPLRWTIRK